MRWTATLVVFWACLAAFALVQKALPASWWLDVSSIRVEAGSEEDGCFPMGVERTINREFYGEWIVTIMRRTSAGGYSTYQTFRGANDYHPDNDLPDDLNLCWWAGAERLDLMPGAYRAHTLWKLRVDGGTREVRRRSNAFEVPE